VAGISTPRILVDLARSRRDDPAMEQLGNEFAHAVAAKDAQRLADLLHADVDFGAMTPSRTWEASDPAGVVDTVFNHWFEPKDEIEQLERLETDVVGDRERVGYRFRVQTPDGRFVVEQQAYLAARDGRIEWMRVVCSGFRPE